VKHTYCRTVKYRRQCFLSSTNSTQMQCLACSYTCISKQVNILLINGVISHMQAFISSIKQQILIWLQNVCHVPYSTCKYECVSRCNIVVQASTSVWGLMARDYKPVFLTKHIAFSLIKTHGSESWGQERAKQSPKTKHATNYCVSFTWASVFVIWRHNHNQYLLSCINF